MALTIGFLPLAKKAPTWHWLGIVLLLNHFAISIDSDSS